jgi:hypothetical protein
MITGDACRVRLALLLVGALIGGASLAAVGPAAAGGPEAFKFTKVADTDTTVTGGGKLQFGTTDTPAVSGGTVVFIAGNSATGERATWTAKTNGSDLKKVITPKTRVPPGGLGTFKQYFGDWVQIYRNTVVLVGDNCGGCGAGVGIYAVPASGGTVKRLVDTSMARPDDPKTKFGGFPNDFDVNGGRVVFQNDGKVYAVPIRGGRVTAVAALDGTKPQPSPPSPYCCIFASPTVEGTTVLVQGGNVYGRDAIESVGANGAVSSFRFVATSGMHAPGTPASYRFDNFEFARPVIGKAMVFRGGSEAENKPRIFGIYSAGKGLAKLVDTNTRVPGGKGTFRAGSGGGDFDVIAASDGIVVFLGYDADGTPGIYAVGSTGGAIRKIIRKGDRIGGFTVDQLFLRREGFEGGTLAFLVSYTAFEGAGIYTTKVALP